MTEPQDLTEFRERLWTVARAARNRHDWCNTFYTVMREEFGLSGSSSTVSEPTEDGLYQVEGYTYFFIRYQGEWIRTALQDPRAFTSQRAGTWDDMLAFMQEKNILPREDGQIIKIG